MQNKVSFDCVAAWWKDLTEPQKNAFADDPLKVSEFLDSRVKEIAANTFVAYLSDEEAIQLLIQQKGYGEDKAKAIVSSWRKYASDMGYNGPVAWKVKQGFTLKAHAPLIGSCCDRLNYLQSWNFTDTPTSDSLVFWVPRLAEQSTNKTVKQMESHRTEQRQAHNLPDHHCVSFGSIALPFALILSHFKRVGERVPLNCLYAASDTLGAGGRRLVAGHFDSDGLYCYRWLGSFGDDHVGFFLLGVEILGQPAQQAGE